MDAVELAAGDRQVAPGGRAAGQHHRVELGAQLVRGDVDTDVDAGAEFGALGPHLVQAAIQVALFHLELGNAVAQQPADPVGALEDRHLVSGPGQLLCGGQTGWAGPHHGHRLAGVLSRLRRQRDYPAFIEGVVDDLDFDLLDRHRILVDAEHTR